MRAVVNDGSATGRALAARNLFTRLVEQKGAGKGPGFGPGKGGEGGLGPGKGPGAGKSKAAVGLDQLEAFLQQHDWLSKKDVKVLLRQLKEGDLSGLTRAVKALQDPKWYDKALELWKSGLLSGPITHMANAMSTGFFRSIRDIESLVASGADAMISGLTGRERTRYAREVSWGMASVGAALRGEAGHQLIRDLQAIASLRELEQSFPGNTADHRRGAISGKKGEAVRIPFKALTAVDNTYKHAAAIMAAYKIAYRRAMAESKRTGQEPSRDAVDALVKEMVDVAKNLKKSPHWEKHKDDFPKIREALLADTFQTPLEGLWAASTAGFRSPLMQVIVPFVTTPANIVRETLKRTPVGFTYREFWKALNAVRKGDKPYGDELETIAKPIIGSLMAYGMFTMAQEGLITGAGPQDMDEKEAKLRTGWSPYSVKIDGKYHSYQRLEPFSSIMGMAADLAEGYKEWDEMTTGQNVARIMSSITENLTNKTFLSGLENMALLWSNPLRYGEQWIKNMEGSLVPNILGQTARALDPVYRKQEIGLDPIKARIPGLSQTLPAQTTPTGEERLRPGTGFFNRLTPVPATVEKTDPISNVAREMVRVHYAPPPARDYLEFHGRRVTLQPHEYKRLTDARKRASEILAQAIQNPAYKALPDNEQDPKYRFGQKLTKAGYLRKIYERHMSKAYDQIKPVAYRRAKTMRAEDGE
jgi:hypothetical protein